MKELKWYKVRYLHRLEKNYAYMQAYSKHDLATRIKALGISGVYYEGYENRSFWFKLKRLFKYGW